MELNTKTIHTTIKALQIAKEITALEYSKSKFRAQFALMSDNVKFDFLESQTDLIDLIADLDSTLKDFQQLASRQQDYAINEE